MDSASLPTNEDDRTEDSMYDYLGLQEEEPDLEPDVNRARMDNPELDLNSKHYMVLRVKARDETTKPFLMTWLDTLKSYYVLGVEDFPVHYHCVIYTGIITVPAMREKLNKEFMYVHWPVRGRGFGSESNLQQCKKLIPAISYAVKMRLYENRGFPITFVEFCASLSFERNTKAQFQKAYQLIVKQFHEDEWKDMNWFMKQFMLLKSKHGHMCNISHAYQYALSNEIKRAHNANSSRFLDNLVDKYLYDQ